jgi:transposase
VLGLGEVDDDQLYTALDWLLARQAAIETALAKRHLQNGTLVLYDVSSSYMEGRCCPLAKRGYSRDGKNGTLQIVYGLLCAPDGCPVAIEVFDGNTGDPTTLTPQIDKLKQRFGLSHVVLVGDRGMITEARITEDIKAAGLDWITALRGPAIKDLLNSGVLQLTLFDQRDMASITAPDFPGERLVVCRNPELAAERSRKREDLLAATEI